MSSPRPPHLADALALAQWADRVDARTDFPRLVRRLIRQTNDQVVTLEMRAAEGAGFGGFDGVVEASRATPFVPAGASVWEMGVGANPESKANEDYKTRTGDSLGIDKAVTTFVFVTPRRWPGKAQWMRDKQTEGVWADVRGFDADDIETAFETAPAVQYWFSEQIGLPVDGVRMIESWWVAFAGASQPELTAELVLAGRADQAAALLRILEQETRLTTVSAPSTDDILAFVAATLLSTAEPARTDLLARTLIVHDAAALRRIDATTDLLVLLPFEDELRREAQLVRSNHIILLAPQDMPSDISLPSIDRDVFAAALVDVGVEKTVAEQLALAAFRSLVAFQSEAPARGAPRRNWTSALESKVPRRACLAGGWHEARSGDTDALSALFGMPYEDARSELGPLTTGEDPLFATVGGTWGLTSVEDAWRFGLSNLSGPDLVALETTIQNVLGAVDPALELAAEERWMAGIHGKTRIHSSDLRTGLATTLAALGAFGAAVRVGAIGTVSDWSASMVAQLLRRANEDESGDVWASLSDVLPLLAEAAPDVFLRAVQEGSKARSAPLLSKMFLDQDGDVFSVSSPHTGLLWALEGLAWSSDYAPLAATLLAGLAEIDPGGRLSNRPLGSLVDFFRPWLPQTSLPIERRVVVLDTLRRDHPEIAWKLMLLLLPDQFGIRAFTHVPRFRQWKTAPDGATVDEFHDFVSTVAQRLIDDAGLAIGRWLDVVEHLSQFPPAERPIALGALRNLADSGSADETLQDSLWKGLEQLVRHHRSFPDAEWSLLPDELMEIAQVAEAFKPEDPRRTHAWLFDQHLPDMGGEWDDFEAVEARVQAARLLAVSEILAADGVDGLVQFADEVDYPASVGSAAASLPSLSLEARALELLDAEDSKRANFASGYAFRRARDKGTQWVEQAIASAAGHSLRQARLLQVMDDLPRAWLLVSELGGQIELEYWREFSAMGRGADFDLVNEAARGLRSVGRTVAALDALALYVRKEDRRVSYELLLETLQEFVGLPADHEEQARLSSYELNTLLDYLRSSDVDEQQLGALEWQLLPALGFDARSPTLERRLARSPEFFVELLSLVYKPRDEQAESVDVPEHVASNAYRLLREWKIVPGSDDGLSVIDSEKLNDWVNTARVLARETGRSEVGDVQIGHVLAHSRADDDGSWPTRPVRDLIERLASPELEQGFQIEIYNSRGTTSRGLTDGGAQERVLVAKYEAMAARIRDGWPRTAATISALARGYEREAERNDEEAERFRQGMDR